MDTAFTEVSVAKGGKYVKSGKKSKYRVLDRSKIPEKRVIPDVEEFGEILPIDTDILKGRNGYRWLKRTADIVLGTAALIVLTPFMIGVAAAIYIDDPREGPIYIQDRVGKNGRIFRMYKFRSMIPGADKMLEEAKAAGQNQKDDDDPTYKAKIEDESRLTRLGPYLRRTSIDELPQLVNVIKGEMSIVGPRPLATYEEEEFDDFSVQRHVVKPGLTCYWQSSMNRDDIRFPDWMKLDVKYIQNCSLWEDFKIICRTFRVVLTANGN